MEYLMSTYEKLRSGGFMTEFEYEQLTGANLGDFQYAALTAALLLKENLNEIERAFANWVFSGFDEAYLFCSHGFASHPLVSQLSKQYATVAGTHFTKYRDLHNALLLTRRSSVVGHSTMSLIVKMLAKGELPYVFLAIWLMTICERGLSHGDRLALTQAMAHSGETFDYRDLPELDHRRILSRYPTGALSEKTALILPSLLSAFARDYPVASPFLIAKTLGFTGGTWDKLSAIPGFDFPVQGEDAIKVLQDCHVAMCVTTGNYNPADRVMYQIRHLTGTIDSEELIVASIGSKHLAMPPDRLLLDVRFGNGAFVGTLSGAAQLGKALVDTIESGSNGSVACDSMLTDTLEPTGMSIGNQLEVAEAATIVYGVIDTDLWDIRALEGQKQLVAEFFARLMHGEFPNDSIDKWRARAARAFANGEVRGAFERLLLAHGVQTDTIELFAQDPSWLIRDLEQRPVLAKKKGVLRGIDQKKLGHIVNFEIQDRSENGYSRVSAGGGILLRKRLGDLVEDQEPVCSLFAGGTAGLPITSLEDSIVGCFAIEQS